MLEQLLHIESLVRTLSKTAPEEVLGEVRNVWRKRVRFFVEIDDLQRYIVMSLAHEGRLASKHLKHSAAQGPNVGKSFVLFVQNDLRGHPTGGSNVRAQVRVVESLGRSEIGQLGGALTADQNVGSFDVPVDHPVTVEVLQAEEDLLGVSDDNVLGKRTVGFEHG
jgi:hypothetical protein